MLKKLVVKNFAIIEDAEISFRDGLTVLTGETGAGKSLIIDSIDLLLGERANSELIRNGQDKAIIEGTFSVDNKRLNALLEKLDIDYNGNEIVITRTISNSKNVVKINNTPITLNELKGVAKYLADIHQQFDMIKLLNKENYLDVVDGFKYELINDYKNQYLDSVDKLKIKEEEYLNLKAKIDDLKKKRDTYEYELNELKSMNLRVGEEDEINSEISLLKNYDKIYDLLLETKQITDKDVLADIYQIKNNLEKLATYQNEYNELSSRVTDHYYELEDVFEQIGKKFKNLDYDPKRLDELETRKSELHILQNKYGKNIGELLEYQEELAVLLGNDANYDDLLKKSFDEFKSCYEETYKLALNLSKARAEVSRMIEKELTKHLSDLGLSNRFEIRTVVANKVDEPTSSIFPTNGIDDLDFYIETNVGEGLKPLAKIASGGEISRIMLAIKTLFVKSQKISTVIFDEIDTGISGEVARKVALKIRDISLSSQVIIITHLPQVASLSNNHIKISKSVRDGRTYTSIKELNLEEKIYEIALMISDGKVTPKQLEYAKELILNQD